MAKRVPVHVRAMDPISVAGLSAALRGHPEIEIIEQQAVTAETVGLVAADSLTEPVLALVRSMRRLGCERFVLVTTTPQDIDLMAAIELGVSAMVARQEATTNRMAQLIMMTASGEAAMPADVLGRLLRQVSRLQHQVLAPRGLSVSGMADREIEILRLVADGYDTRDIAKRLAYSERTVKNALHDITTRFQLKNRSHAVAYAVREGLI
ncbi:helix-turn-helix transcriptional regulator [Actinocatenispora thailandica]|uniref:Helix-turn-helix transcriptional regulator n=1 Tax=Actinocatenispora thailandica TaxID=227318 RepID=A0A7R7DT67_9ACTN|nr:response regulator transcription factor [Actinocatenispora thailandica]BCJ37220.1 helix-turn-helix transcriptional regulator [Actinocatenispora thailandica]